MVFSFTFTAPHRICVEDEMDKVIRTSKIIIYYWQDTNQFLTKVLEVNFPAHLKHLTQAFFERKNLTEPSFRNIAPDRKGATSDGPQQSAVNYPKKGRWWLG